MLVLALAVYYPRHRRADLVTAFVTINLGVLAVTVVLANSAATVGLGLGLFGVLSIIRLRSDELAQHEVAYYLAALAIGLIAGLSTSVTWLSVGLVTLVVGVLAIVDSPAVLRRSREQQFVLERAYLDETELRAAVEHLLGTPVHRITTRNIDLVADTTVVDVRYSAPRPGSAPARHPETLQTLGLGR